MSLKFIKTGLLSTAIASSILLGGCASMFGDNTRTVSVSSQPQGADIYIDNIQYGTTPAMITLPGYIYGGKVLVLKKQGYQDRVIMVNSVFQPVTLWNLLNGIGFIIDAATGDILKIDPSTLNVTTNLVSAKARASQDQ